MHWGFDALQKLLPEELLSTIQTTQVDPHVPAQDSDRLPLFNGETGEFIKYLDGDKFYRLRRDKFRNWLLQGVEVEWGKKLNNVTYSEDGRTVTAHFRDGSHAIGSLLIGCDGAHSAVRTQLVGAGNSRLRSVGYGAGICFSQHTREHALALRAPPFHPVYQVIVHPVGLAAWFSLQDGEEKDHPENWIFLSYISYKEPLSHEDTMTPAELLTHQKSLAKNFADPVKCLYEWMTPEKTAVEHIKFQNWDPRLPEHRWDSRGGRVTLAGDAAHPMTFQRGQGLNNALQDAAELEKSIEDWWIHGKVSEERRMVAITAYEKEMIARGGLEVELSANSSHVAHKSMDGFADRIATTPLAYQLMDVTAYSPGQSTMSSR